MIFINIENFLGFLTTLSYSLKEARQLFFILKNMFSVLLNPLHSFSDVLGFHEQIETKIRKWGDQKLEKCEGGV